MAMAMVIGIDPTHLDEVKVDILALQVCYIQHSLDTDLSHGTLQPTNTATITTQPSVTSAAACLQDKLEMLIGKGTQEG